jgi:hypothetical protein
MPNAANVTFASSGTNFSFSAKRPASRGGSTPFNLTTNNGSGAYQVGGISLITAFEVNLPDIAANPSAYNYGNVDVGASVSQIFVVTNEGLADLQVTTTTLVGANSGEFSIDNGGGAFMLAPTQSRNLTVSFNPISAGSKIATLRFESNDPDENPFDIALAGNGVDPNIVNTVVFATNSVWLKQNANILSGNVLVNNASPGPVLDSQVELSVGQDVHTPAGFALKAHHLKVKLGALVARAVYYNELTNNGTITGALHTPLALPDLSTLPPFNSSPAGAQNIEVAQEGFISLDAGDYGDILVRAKGKLLFTGGVYNIRSLDTGDHAQLLFAAPSEVRVEDKFDTDLKAYIGPQEGSGISAADIIFYIAGINGNNGNLGATPKAAQIGINNTALANFYAPNGTLWIRDDTHATGAFWGKDVIVGIGVELTLESFFANSGAPLSKAHRPENRVNEENSSLTSAQPQIPEHFALEQNYPNPFLSEAKSPAFGGGNPETEIRFQLPEASHVVVRIFNTLGKEIRTLANAPYQAGYHSVRWDGNDKNGNPVSSGVYFYQLLAANFSQIKKMSLLR